MSGVTGGVTGHGQLAEHLGVGEEGTAQQRPCTIARKQVRAKR